MEECLSLIAEGSGLRRTSPLLKLMESPLDVQQLQAIMQGNARRLLPRG
jgi:hypothetical protein